MSKNDSLENASNFNLGTSTDSKPMADEIDADLANFERKIDGSAVLPTDSDRSNEIDETDDGQTADSETSKRKAGAPKNNLNNFRHGFYSKQLQRAKKGRLKGSARRKAAETLRLVLDDQGGPDNCSMTLQFICQRFSKRVARLSQMEKAVGNIIKKNPLVLEVPNALAKLYSFLRPIEQDAIDDAKTIGFRMANGSSSIADQIRAIEQQQNDEQAK